MVEIMVNNTSQDIEYCKRCHRKLKDEKSRKLGYGKVCYNKINQNNKNYLFNLEDINEIIIKK